MYWWHCDNEELRAIFHKATQLLSRPLQQAIFNDGVIGTWLHRDGHSGHGLSSYRHFGRARSLRVFAQGFPQNCGPKQFFTNNSLPRHIVVTQRP